MADHYHLLLPSEVARLLGISKDRVRQLAKSGALKSIRIRSGFRLFDSKDVEAYTSQRKKVQPNGSKNA